MDLSHFRGLIAARGRRSYSVAHRYGGKFQQHKDLGSGPLEQMFHLD